MNQALLALSPSFDKLRMIGEPARALSPFALSLSKCPCGFTNGFDEFSSFDKLRTRGGFDKLSPNRIGGAP